jgi:outer membrane protein assembly factor BamD (BamD/ComL family)
MMRRAGYVLMLASIAACSSPDAEIAAPPPDLEARFDAALDLVDEQKYDQACEILEPLMVGTQAHPRRDAILFLLAEANYQRGELESAAEQFEALAARHPESPYARATPARLLAIGIELSARAPLTILDALARDRRPVIEALGRAAVDDPAAATADDAFIELAKTHIEEIRGDLAVLALERLLEEHPGSPRAEEAWFKLAEAWRSRTRGAGYDPRALVEARAAAVRYLERFGPAGEFAVPAAEIIKETTASLIAHEEQIAEFYRLRGNSTGEALHRANAARLRSEAGDAPDSTDLLRPRPHPADIEL